MITRSPTNVILPRLHVSNFRPTRTRIRAKVSVGPIISAVDSDSESFFRSEFGPGFAKSQVTVLRKRGQRGMLLSSD